MGSNPIARSRYPVYGWHDDSSESLIASQRFIHGDVAKWQGKGLQNPHHGFKSRRRLKKNESAMTRFLFLQKLRYNLVIFISDG